MAGVNGERHGPIPDSNGLRSEPLDRPGVSTHRAGARRGNGSPGVGARAASPLVKHPCSVMEAVKRSGAVLAAIAAMSYGSAAYGQAPADGARFPANATIEFSVDESGLGEQHRLKIARDAQLAHVVYDRADPDEIGQWFVVPRNRGMGPGTYYWQSCWADFDLSLIHI